MSAHAWPVGSDARPTLTAQFMDEHAIDDYDALVARSIDDPGWFWDAAIDFLGIPFRQSYTEVLSPGRDIATTTWFTGGLINLSEVCVDRWADEEPHRVAVLVESEDGDTEELTYVELHSRVCQGAGALASVGVGHGDTVACFLPFGVDAVVAFLATARLGAIFVPIFSGFGAPAVAARLVDSGARVLLTADGFRRRGKPVAAKAVADEAVVAPGSKVDTVFVVRHDGGVDVDWDDVRDHWWDDALDPEPDACDAVDTDPEDPVLLAYTSGTTGKPKGVVHVHGGFTVKLVQEAAFAADIQAGDVVSWVTDMGWIMGPWITVGALAQGATLAIYDGAPDFPDPGRLWRFVDDNEVTFLGVSPTLVRALSAAGDEHLSGHSLASLRSFGSTGEPWNAEPWQWLFDRVGERVRGIVNISGGTEVGACFLAVNAEQGLKPVSVGGPSLGMAVDVFGDDGRPVRPGDVGELVCTKPWPGMARTVWGDPQRFLDTYFSRWPGVWVHGDWASVDGDGFWFLHGRSDDTLNIAGKRIGPAEIESAVVALPGVVMAAAIGVPDDVKGEALVVYAVPSSSATPGLADDVAAAVVAEFGKPFAPKAVQLVPDLPRTRSAKIVRRAVRARALGADPGDLSTLENPEALAAIDRL